MISTLLLLSGVISYVPPPTPIRIATFNVSLTRDRAGALIEDLSSPDDAQAAAVAEIIQRTRPDIILLNEFDYDADGRALTLFQENYLAIPHHRAEPITYEHTFIAPVNTGIHSGLDLDNSGGIHADPGSRGYANDCFGFGAFPGQYGMAILSRSPINTADIRTFRNFLWKDMPGALLPDNPATPEPADFSTAEELAAFRLSSKSHWIIPITVDGGTIHILAAHPTPPAFDGPEDRNGRRNHDEIRLLADLIDPEASAYITDDNGKTGGLPAGAHFIILGDLNADPRDGGSLDGAIDQLLGSPRITTSITPASSGGPEAAGLQGGINASHTSDPAHDTADFADEPPARAAGNLRTDYALPSATLALKAAGVFWPATTDPLSRLTGPGGDAVISSDHRLVWIDIEIPRPLAPRSPDSPIAPTGSEAIDPPAD